jgi:hypothetical protein
MFRAIDASRVTKKLGPYQPGAVKLSRRYGDALVCVRYRQDVQGRYRYTTVELIVDQAPVQPARRSAATPVALRIDATAADLKGALRDAGAVWDPTLRAWRLPYGQAKRLNLLRFMVAP